MKRIVFACVENSCRSQMAEGFANELLKRGQVREPVEVCSAGSCPSGRVNEHAVRFMAERGIDISGHRSCGFEHDEYDYLITMGCGDACPSVAAATRIDWQLPDPKHLPDEEFRQVRDELEQRVEKLFEMIFET